MKKLVITLFILSTLTSCTTGYHRKEGGGSGYSEMSLGNDMYKVTFQGSSVIDSDTVYNFFLRRCAEITAEKGFDFFAFVDQSDSSKTRIENPTIDTYPYNYRSNRRYYQYPAPSYTITEYSRHGVIKLFKKGQQPPTAIEAKEVLKNFKDK